ncbi:TPA: L-lactate permease [Candidatus Nomurabacteria bacterium]|nr:MAG: L-lactate permease [Parcubacteria bacterium RAAC4_OD1_1]HCY26438.1 L-lactate permease [Candidatus Nomurabacteria bacterium]
MIDKLPIFLSIFPFLVFIYLLLIKKTTLLKSSLVTALLYTILVVLYWKIIPNYLYISYGKGFFIALDIFIIIFGAIFFLEILKDLKIIKNISFYLKNFSSDYRIQIIIIAWFFEAFLEGTAGFGVPVAIAVPLLMGIGLTPMKSLIIGLLGNSTPGVFGAAGTPIRVGFSGLNVSSVPFYASLFNLVGILIPVFMLFMITIGRPNRNKEFFEALPFAIWSGIAFTIPSLFIVSLGQEFPSILGAVVGFILVAITTRFGIFVPKNNISLISDQKEEKTMSIFKSFLPYLFLIILLVLGKFLIGKIGIPINIGFRQFFNFYNPGFIFIITGFLIIFFYKSKKKIFKELSLVSLKGAIGPFLVILFMSSMVQIIINSGQNLSGLPSALSLMSSLFETRLIPFFAPFIGGFGAFITGSVTLSNIMFGSLFNLTSLNMGFNPSIILSLGVAGGAAGNMIALADILTAEAVIGEKNKEREVLRGVIIPCLTYLLILGIIGILIF